MIVPKGVEHRPVAGEEVAVLLFEPVGTLNTGNVNDARLTVSYAGLIVRRGFGVYHHRFVTAATSLTTSPTPKESAIQDEKSSDCSQA